MDFKQMCRIIIGVYFSDKFFIFYISYVYLDCQYMSGDKWKYPHHETIICPRAEFHPALLLKQIEMIQVLDNTMMSRLLAAFHQRIIQR